MEKKVRSKKTHFGSDGPKLDGCFRTLDAFFRPFGHRPDGPQPKKVRLKFEGKKAFACLHCVGKSSKDNLSPKLSNTPECPQLSVESYPHACRNERAKHSQNQSKEDRNDGIKHVNENQYFGNLRSCTFNQPKSKMAPATMICKLAMWHIYLISTVSAVPP